MEYNTINKFKLDRTEFWVVATIGMCVAIVVLTIKLCKYFFTLPHDNNSSPSTSFKSFSLKTLLFLSLPFNKILKPISTRLQSCYDSQAQ